MARTTKTNGNGAATGAFHNVIPPLAPFLVDATKVREDPKNSRHHTDRNLDAIAFSLKKFGQRTPIVVNKSGVIEKGSGTFRAATTLLHWTQIAAIMVDDDADTAAAYALADNKTGDPDVGSVWDVEQLQETMRQLDRADMMGMGWAEGEIDLLLAGEFVPPELDPAFHDDGTKAGETSVAFTPEQWAIMETAFEALPGNPAQQERATMITELARRATASDK